MTTAFIKLTPWRLGQGTHQAVHDHKKAESFILDRIVSLREKTYDAVTPRLGPKIPAQTVTVIRYAGTNQMEEFEVMEPKHEAMRMCAAGAEFQSGKKFYAGPAKGYVEIVADWDRVHRVQTIMDQFNLTEKQASLAHDMWMMRRKDVRGTNGDQKPARVPHFSEIIAHVRREYPSPSNTQRWQEKLDLLDAEMSEALHAERNSAGPSDAE